MSSFTREVDKVGRWGGEEFSIICPYTSNANALVIAEKLRRIIESEQLLSGHKITHSFGVP